MPTLQSEKWLSKLLTVHPWIIIQLEKDYDLHAKAMARGAGLLWVACSLSQGTPTNYTSCLGVGGILTNGQYWYTVPISQGR